MKLIKFYTTNSLKLIIQLIKIIKIIHINILSIEFQYTVPIIQSLRGPKGAYVALYLTVPYVITVQYNFNIIVN